MTEGILVSAIILSGGRGRRMSFKDKGLQILGDKALIQHVIDSIKSEVTEIIISHNRNEKAYLQFGFPLVTDRDSDFLGPLAGILSARPKVKQALCFITPCDVPNLPTGLVTNMLSKIDEHDAVCLYSEGKPQALPLLVKTQAIDSINEYLSKGNRSVKQWLEGLDLYTLVIEAGILDNINDLEHLKRAESDHLKTPTKKPSN